MAGQARGTGIGSSSTNRARPVPLTQRPALPGRPRSGIAVTLLGGFALAVNGRSVDLSVGLQRLVAVLALRGGMSRSRLGGTLWPDGPEHRMLASLRTAIWRLNQVAPDMCCSRAGTLSLDPRVAVDARDRSGAAVDFLRREERTDGSEFLADSAELLPDWDEEWLLAERERIRQLHLHVLEVAAERFAKTGRYGLALEAAMMALRMDGLRESAYRSMIEIHLAEGNVVEARRAYSRCRLDVADRDRRRTEFLHP